MKTTLILAALLSAGTLAWGAPLPAPTCPEVTSPKLAPADESFGQFHYSIFGISNYETKFVAVVTDPTLTPVEKMNKVDVGADNVASAINDLSLKFPADTSIPESLYTLAHIYAGIGTPDDDSKARAIAVGLALRCPDSQYGDRIREELSEGPLQGPTLQ